MTKDEAIAWELFDFLKDSGIEGELLLQDALSGNIYLIQTDKGVDSGQVDAEDSEGAATLRIAEGVGVARDLHNGASKDVRQGSGEAGHVHVGGLARSGDVLVAQGDKLGDYAEPWVADRGFVKDAEGSVVAMCSGSMPVAKLYAKMIAERVNRR